MHARIYCFVSKHACVCVTRRRGASSSPPISPLHLPYISLHLPYRDQAAGRIQLAALVQLEFTYVTAALFFDRQPKALQGEALVLCNSLVVLVMLIVAVRAPGVLGG